MNIANHQLALEAAFQLNKELLSDQNFQGYEGSLEQFQLLCAECLYIIENEMRVVGVTQWTVDKFYENQNEMAEGGRHLGYFMED
jgi:hypothetical protein